MADLIKRTEELILAVNAGARAIENTKRYHGTTYCLDVFSDKPKEIPYLKAAQILREFDELSTVDAVEVVRCKDCKHYHKEIGWCDEHSSFIDDSGAKCHPWESSDWRMFDDDDFCSYGERREEDG